MSFLHEIIAEFHGLHLADYGTVLTLALLEGILSVDNSLVLAILVRPLPPRQRRRALTYGIVGAFVFRLAALVFASHMMRFVLFKAVGGGYLIYLAMKHLFFSSREEAHRPSPSTTRRFWKTVLVVELTDIAFSIDSITTAVAMSRKLAVVWMGGIMGIIFLRFAAGLFVRLLETLPKLEDLAYQLIFFIGTKLFLESFHIEIAPAAFWIMMGVIVILGSSIVYRDMRRRREAVRLDERLVLQLEAGDLAPETVLDRDTVSGYLLRTMKARGYLSLSSPDRASAAPTGASETPADPP